MPRRLVQDRDTEEASRADQADPGAMADQETHGTMADQETLGSQSGSASVALALGLATMTMTICPPPKKKYCRGELGILEDTLEEQALDGALEEQSWLT